MRSSMVAPFAAVVIKLLQGPLYNDDATTWNILLSYTEQVRLYCAQMGQELRFHEEDGFAYLHQPSLTTEDEKPFDLPRLTRRIPLSKPVSLLCVLLREQLLLFETSNLEGVACVLTREQIYELMQPMLPERTNELSVLRKVDAWIEQVVDLGFLKKRPLLGPNYFEVRRILKAKINAEKLEELKERLKMYGTDES
jgi:Domain of unknown function (DUF4194)